MDTVDTGHQKNWPMAPQNQSPRHTEVTTWVFKAALAGSGWFPSQIARKLLYLRGRTFSLKFCRKKQPVTKHSEALASAFGCLHLCLASNNNCAKRNWLLGLILLSQSIIISSSSSSPPPSWKTEPKHQPINNCTATISKVPGSAQWAPRLSRPNEAVTCTSEQYARLCFKELGHRRSLE